MVGVTGAISAVRRELFHGVPSVTYIPDDLRVIAPQRCMGSASSTIKAHAYDRLPDAERR